MAERMTLVADRFVYEDLSDLQTVVGSKWVVCEPHITNKKITLGYYGDEGSFSGNIDVLELETELYKFAVKRGHVELDWAGSFMIDWSAMPPKETSELLIEVMGFTPAHFDSDFIRNPDKQVVGL